MSEKPQRVSKLLAQKGLCSRREADEYIKKGWVLVDGQVVSLGAKAFLNQNIELKKDASRAQNKKLTILLNKPVGYVSGQAEEGYELASKLIRFENLSELSLSKPKTTYLEGLVAAGRLDIDSKGLLVLTQNGVIAKKLVGENSNIEKEYLVRIEGEVTPDKIRKLEHGLILDGKPLKKAKVQQQNEAQLNIILTEGKKRQVRRMCDMVGLKVTELIRVRIGQVRLGKLKEGQWRVLEKNERF